MIEKYFHSKVVITMLIFLGFSFWSFFSVYMLNQTTIYAENGLIENIQVSGGASEGYVMENRGNCRCSIGKSGSVTTSLLRVLCFTGCG